MTQKALREKLRSKNICNEYNFVGRGNVYITYYPAETGRMSCYGRWVVCRPGFKTDKE